MKTTVFSPLCALKVPWSGEPNTPFLLRASFLLNIHRTLLMDLTDQQWAAICHQVPLAHQGPGRPALDSRSVLNGIFWKIRSDSAWRRLPSCYPSHQSCHRFYKKWQASGLFNQLLYILYADLFYRGNFSPYQAVAEKRIWGRVKNRTFKLYIAPAFVDDWRTHTALLFLQVFLNKVLNHLAAESGKGYARVAHVRSFLLCFSQWPKYAPFKFERYDPDSDDDGYPDPGRDSRPEDVILEFGRD
jgi:transposase